MELGEKVPAIAGETGRVVEGKGGSAHPHRTDLESGLVNLGFKMKEILPVVESVLEENSESSFTALFTRALERLRSGARR